MLRDPFDDNVIPIVEELQRRLQPVDANFLGQGDDEDGTGGQTEAQTSESTGILFTLTFTLFSYQNPRTYGFGCLM